MVTNYGFIRNTGYSIIMNSDAQYRYYAETVFKDDHIRKYYIDMYFTDPSNKRTKLCIWLCLIGLYETWDII